MRSEAIVMSQNDYDAWYSGATKAASAPAPGGANAGLAVFNANGCGACHALAAAHASGKVGPDLDKLKQEAAGAHQQLDAFIRQSIVDPNAYVAPGYQKGVMPATFGQTIPKPKLDQLVQYLSSNAK